MDGEGGDSSSKQSAGADGVESSMSLMRVAASLCSTLYCTVGKRIG